MTVVGLHCGREWGSLAALDGPGWQGSSHPATRVCQFPRLDEHPLIFRGTFEHALDAKHRLTIPAKFRAALADGVVLAASHEVQTGAPRTVAHLDARGLRRSTRTRRWASLNPASPTARELKRFFFNTSVRCSSSTAPTA